MTCLQTLVDHSIDVTTEDKDGRSPADYAYAAGQTGCARYLVMEESCWLLSQRVAKLHKELKDCKEENKDLKKRLEVSYRFLVQWFISFIVLLIESRGVLLGILGGDVSPGSPNPDPISNQNMPFSIHELFSDLTS